MTYRSILVSLDIEADNESVVKLATQLASRFEARLIGVAAANVPPPMVSVDGMVFDGGLMQQERQNIEERLAVLRRRFESIAGARGDAEWRGAVDSPTRHLLDNVRAADLVVAGSGGNAFAGSPHRSIDTGSLILNAGRPVLIAQSGSERLAAHRVLIAWKDTREGRRAVRDALPLLVDATDVLVATVDAEGGSDDRSGLGDVAAFLARHGVKVRTELIRDADADEAITRSAQAMNADLVVSGAYGHSRIRELVFGGVTRTLLAADGFSRLMSS